MTREEKIKNLYLETYEEEDIDTISLAEMEESLEEYYRVAGFDIKSVDDLFNNHEENSEFIKTMEEKIEKKLESLK